MCTAILRTKYTANNHYIDAKYAAITNMKHKEMNENHEMPFAIKKIYM